MRQYIYEYIVYLLLLRLYNLYYKVYLIIGWLVVLVVIMSDSCDAIDCNLSGSSVHGILWARILEWFGISSPGDLPDPGIEPGSPVLQADSLPTELQGSPNYRIAYKIIVMYYRLIMHWNQLRFFFCF